MLFVHKKNNKKVIFLDGFFSATKRMVANLEIDCHNKTKRYHTNTINQFMIESYAYLVQNEKEIRKQMP